MSLQTRDLSIAGIPRNKCNGCFTCKSVCKQSAISDSTDSAGFSYPVVNDDLCILCKKCIQVCPANSSSASRQPIACFAAISKNADLLKKSSSGGMFGEIASLFTQRNGIVYGCKWDDDFKSASHSYAYTPDEITKFYTSKYVQSNLNGIFAHVKSELRNNKPILFSGTPCQVYALNKYLEDDAGKVAYVDFICHGVPSPGVFQKYIFSLERKNKSEIVYFNFRHKDEKKKKNIIGYKLKNNNEFLFKSRDDDLYFSLFNFNYILRESCFTCTSKSGRSLSDITIGDFWGIEKIKPSLTDYGCSCVVIWTPKGLDIWNSIKEELEYYDVKYEDIINNNKSIIKPSSKPIGYAFFSKIIAAFPFSFSARIVLGVHLFLRLCRKLNRLITKH